MLVSLLFTFTVTYSIQNFTHLVKSYFTLRYKSVSSIRPLSYVVTRSRLISSAGGFASRVYRTPNLVSIIWRMRISVQTSVWCPGFNGLRSNVPASRFFVLETKGPGVPMPVSALGQLLRVFVVLFPTDDRTQRRADFVCNLPVSHPGAQKLYGAQAPGFQLKRCSKWSHA